MSLSSNLRLAALLLAAVAPPARAEIYGYRDAEGTYVFSNAPTDPRFRKVVRTSDVGGLYRSAPRVASTVGGGARPKLPTAWADAIRGAAADHTLPEELILAVIAVESNFNPNAVSEKGASGLMQLMPGTARDMYVGDAFDPVQNIYGGARYLRILANQYGGDMVKMLAAYNAGPEAVRRAQNGAVPNIPETKAYVRKVSALYAAYRKGP